MRKFACAVAAIAAFSCGSANAGVVVPIDTALRDFNAIIFTNASTQHDIEGAAVIGGNFQGATVYKTPGAKIQPAGFGALTVYGKAAGNDININNGGSAYVGVRPGGARINFNGGGHFIGAPGTSIADFQTSFTNLSTSLSLLTANSFLPQTDNNEIINARPGSDGIAVFDITAAQLFAIPSYQIEMNGAKTVIFNVSGNAVNFRANVESGDTGANNIIWNFIDATAVNLQTLIAGTVLAPNAHVTNHNQIDGVLVAKSWTGEGELHNYGFEGTLPPSAAPEPDTWALMLVGFGVLGMALRLRPRRGAVAA